MSTHKYYLVPGPVTVPNRYLQLYAKDYGSSKRDIVDFVFACDLEEEFFEQYKRVQGQLQRLLNTSSTPVIQSGEAMLGLWGALRAVIRPGTRVLSVSSGVYGTGIGTMAEQLGASVKRIDVPWDLSFIESLPQIRQLVQGWQPELITAVHCETPCGILNHVAALGEIARDCNALYYVDFVSSGGGVPVEVDGWHIDLGLLGTQKCLNLPPDLAIVTVSSRAWEVINHVRAVGYEGLADWSPHRLTSLAHVPYTLNWRATAALECSLNDLLLEGTAVHARHLQVSQMTRARLAQELKLTLYPRNPERDSSPTVTAVKVPADWEWRELDAQLRARGVVFGGSWSELQGQVFRIGHMGVQADPSLVMGALDQLQAVLHRRV